MTCLRSSRIHTIGTVPRRDPDAAPQTRQSPSLRPLTAILTIRSASKPCAVPRTQQRNPRDISRQSPSLHPQTEIRKET
ncbi:MAG: hypothetical protein JNK48_16105 [Bryobacterales bacterium]|nr:hypothetical protein [Bryobacterales bacterium]